jgi:transcriptional regulator with XRE-family HTH domain
MRESGYLPGVPAFQALPAALRLLLERSQLNQTELADRSGLSIAVVNRTLRAKQQPSIGSLDAMLDAMHASPADLASALAEVSGEARPQRVGNPRPEWVAALARRALNNDALWGFAIGAIEPNDERAEADFLASVAAAANEAALTALAEARAVREPLAMVAEKPAHYGAPRTKKRR